MKSYQITKLISAHVLLIIAFAADVYAQKTQDVSKSIVKIFTVQTSPDYYSPWSMRAPVSVSGSGCVIKGRKILTNAHVVSDQTFIQVRGYGDSKRYQAHVQSVSHAVDLALLIVDDPEFWQEVAPLEFGDLPRTQQALSVYGFPVGGDALSVTKGVVSRVEHQVYVHSSMNFLAIQVDAAINPGNSGGPAIVNNEIVGVVMQEIIGASSIGYLIPVPIIKHFLDDLQDGRYDGFPSMGVNMQNMDSPTIKSKYQVTDKKNGVRITRVIPNSPADGLLHTGDVLLAVDGYPVADDCTVEFRPNERTFVAYVNQQHQIGEWLNVDILRDGSKISTKLHLTRPAEMDRLIPMEQYDRRPTYFIYGGLVFAPLTVDLLKAWGEYWVSTAPKDLLALLGNNDQTTNRNQIVVLLRVLPSDVNEGYHQFTNLIISNVNGESIRNLEDLIQVVEHKGPAPYITFSHANGLEVIIDRAKAETEKQTILTTYRIPADRSPDLQKN